MKHRHRHDRSRRAGGARRLVGGIALASAVWITTLAARPAQQTGAPVTPETPAVAAPTLEETRLTMSKWIETQQIISKERNDWQQGREILVGRLDLVKKEIATLEEKIQTARVKMTEAEQKRALQQTENQKLEATGAQLVAAVSTLEGEVRRLFKTMPEPIQARIQPLFQRIPEDSTQAKVSVAERFQNVLGILNELNKANTEITVSYEVHTLSSGKPSEVRALYAGLAQAWYVSTGGEAGTGRPGIDGWEWKPSDAISGDVLKALEILQGKHSPEFVALPVKIQ